MSNLYKVTAEGIELSSEFKPIEPTITGHLPEEKGVYLSVLKDDCSLPTNRKIRNKPVFRPLIYMGHVYHAVFVGRTRNLNQAFRKDENYSKTDHASLRKRLGALLGFIPNSYVLQAGKAHKTFTVSDNQQITDWLYDNTFVLYIVEKNQLHTQKLLSQVIDTPLNLIPSDNHSNDEFRKDLMGLLRRTNGRPLRSTWLHKGKAMHAGPWLDALPSLIRNRKLWISLAVLLILALIVCCFI
jgi:hypothetical protein